eukprot:3006058-Alexandrium_andersonii.AAC.1
MTCRLCHREAIESTARSRPQMNSEAKEGAADPTLGGSPDRTPGGGDSRPVLSRMRTCHHGASEPAG